MKKKIIAVITGAVILIIAAGSIYGKSESGHKEGEPDVVGTFSVNRDENITVVANRGHIGDKEAFARELLQMYKDDSFYSTKFSTDRGYATSLDMNIYLWKEDIEDGELLILIILCVLGAVKYFGMRTGIEISIFLMHFVPHVFGIFVRSLMTLAR